jgi:tetratricopeptide (TPR) repeat protein
MLIQCPKCQTAIETADVAAGSEVTCPKCGSRVSSVAVTQDEGEMTCSYVTMSEDSFAVAEPIRLSVDEQRELQAIFRPGIALQDRYILERELGSGAMGDVWLARDSKLQRSVAVKVIQPRLLRQGYNPAQFLHESRVGANLIHPAIAAVFDHGEHAGKLFTVFEYLPGQTLGELIKSRGRLPLDEVRLIIGPLAQALDLMHARGIIHRDLKPDNIRSDEHGNFKIVDFGLASQFANQSHWGFCGTPAYAAPEQAAQVACDGRADQFSLGVITYEMLCGTRPCQHATRKEFYCNHPHCHPSPPLFGVRPPPDVFNALMRAFDAPMRALSNDPANRFESCQAFAIAFGCKFLDSIVPSTGVADEVFVRRGQPGHSFATTGCLLPVAVLLFVVFLDLFGLEYVRSVLGFYFLMLIGLIVQGLLENRRVVSKAMRLIELEKANACLALAGDNLWFCFENEVSRWPFTAVMAVKEMEGNYLRLTLRIRNGQREEWLGFQDQEVCRSWVNEIRARIDRHKTSEVLQPEETDFAETAAPVVILTRRPPARCQILGEVTIVGVDEFRCRSSLLVRGVVLGADAVVGNRRTQFVGLNRDSMEWTGTALRALDSEGKQLIRSSWFEEEIGWLRRRMGYAIAVIVAFITFWFTFERFYLGIAHELPDVIGTALIIGWPVLLLVSSRILRQPQLIRAAGATVFCLAMCWLPQVFGGLLAIYGLENSERPFGNVIKQFFEIALIAPFLTLWGIKVLKRAFAAHRRYLNLWPPGTYRPSVARRFSGMATNLATAVFAAAICWNFADAGYQKVVSWFANTARMEFLAAINRGNKRLEAGELAEAARAFRQSLAIVESNTTSPSKPETQRDRWLAYENLGIVYLQTVLFMDESPQSYRGYGNPDLTHNASSVEKSPTRPILQLEPIPDRRLWHVSGQSRAEILDEALRFHKRGLELVEPLSGESSDPQSQVELSGTYHNLGRVNYQMTRYDVAMEWIGKALSVLKRLDHADQLPPTEQPRIAAAKEDIELCRKAIRSANSGKGEYENSIMSDH